jgi:hypothetical protein
MGQRFQRSQPPFYLLRFVALVLACLGGTHGCESDGKIEAKLSRRAPSPPQSGIVSNKPMQIVELPGVASVGLPAGATRGDTILTLEETTLPLPEGAKLIGQPVLIRIRSTTGTAIDRTSIRDDIIVSLQGGLVGIDQDSLGVLMVVDNGKPTERKVFASKMDISVSVGSNEDGHVIVRMRDTDATLALVVVGGGGVPGYGTFTPPPLDPSELSGKISSDGILTSQWTAPSR